MRFDYDVIVIGGGHAGCEASHATARLGARTLLLTSDMNRIAQMSCNPAVGGIAKGQIVREIDALGGMMGVVTDRTAIQFRMLNRSKGPAVWSPRAQSDRTRFIDEWRRVLDSTPGLDIFQDTATEFVFAGDGGEILGVRTGLGCEFRAKKIILTAGTFLNGEMHFGPNRIPGGRISEPASYGLSEQLRERGLRVQRMKTGTPVRIDGRSVDFSLTQPQQGDDRVVKADSEEVNSAEIIRDFHKFSFLPEVRRELMPRECHILHTNKDCHEILHSNLDKSPLYNGQIQSIGPRYCPSIETKIVTFADKDSHQLFLEPEGEDTQEYYLNGFSSSLPMDVQLAALQKIPALKNVQIYRPGYAIEYDFFDPTQLRHSLESRLVPGLYLAGQVNGTTGYEEAAGQGLMAGINAARACKKLPSVVLARDQAYIGVLIDDLVIKGVDEPYRMFTSRAEYRILLRQDDADMRLTPLGYEIGLASHERYDNMLRKREARDAVIKFCKETKITPIQINAMLEEKGSARLTGGCRMIDLVLRPNISITDISERIPRVAEYFCELAEAYPALAPEIIEAAEIQIKYEGYIERERQLADKLHRLEHVKLPPDLDYSNLKAISTEGRQKLSSRKPETVGQASRIPGVSPADVNVLLLLMHR